MGQTGQKIIGALLTLACAYFVFQGIQRTSGSVGGGSQEVSLPGFDAEKMYADLGGSPGAVPVVMFVTEWCSVCSALESELTRRGVQFIRADVEANRTASLYYQALTQSAQAVVPITVVGSRLFLGFKPGDIARAVSEGKAATSAQAA